MLNDASLPEAVINLPSRLGAPELTGVISLLEKDRELQELLGDVQERAEQHRENYSTLKLQHNKLSHQVKILEERLAQALGENEEIKQQLRDTTEQAVEETAELRAQIQVFYEQGPPGKMKIKWVEKLKEEAENNWKSRWKNAIDDLELMESKLKDLQQENNQLRHSYQVGISEVDNTMKEVVFTMESKISSLQAENNRLRELPQTLEKDKQMLCKRIKDLEQKIRESNESNEEKETELKHLVSQSSNSAASALRLEGKLKARIVQLEAEKEGLENQASSTADDLDRKDKIICTLETEMSTLKNQVETASRSSEQSLHEAEVKISQMEMDNVKQLAGAKREKELMNKELLDTQERYNSLKERFNKLDSLHSEEKLSLEKGYQSTNDEANVKLREYETKVGELSSKLTSLESTLQSLQMENSDLKREKTDILSNVEDDLRKLEHENARLRHENQLVKTDIRNIIEERDDVFQQGDNRDFQLKSVIKNLEKEIKDIRTESAKTEKSLSDKNRKYGRLIHKLRSRINLARAEYEDSRLKQKSLDGFITPEEHQRVKNQLLDLQSKHKKFSQILHSLEGVQSFSRIGDAELKLLNQSIESLHQIKLDSLQFLREEDDS